MKKMLIIIVSLALLSSCDEKFDYTVYIENSTESSISLDCSFFKYGGKTDSLYLQVSPNEKKIIYNSYYIRGMGQDRLPIGQSFSHFSVSKDSVLSTYDYLDDNNWIYTPTSDKTAEYTMVVEPFHFN